MAVSLEDKDDLRCSFCGKQREQVANLIAGPGVFICVECVDLCNDIIAKKGDPSEIETAVSEVLSEKALEGLDARLNEIEESLRTVRAAVPVIAEGLAESLRPHVAEVVARLTCPHCGRRLDAPADAPSKAAPGSGTCA